MSDLVAGEVIASPSKTLTDAHFLFFAGLTGDNHPIHYDVEYAKASAFGRPLAHGLLLAAMTAAGASALSPRLEGLVFIEQGCRFLKPAFVGDTITPTLTVERIWSQGAKQFVRLQTALTNQRHERVLEGFQIYRVTPRGGRA